MGVPIVFDAYRITSVGVTQGATVASSNAALPATTSGINSGAPRFVRVLTDAACYIKFGAAGLTCTLNDIFISPNMPEVFAVSGAASFAVITRAATANVNVTAIEI